MPAFTLSVNIFISYSTFYFLFQIFFFLSHIKSSYRIALHPYSCLTLSAAGSYAADFHATDSHVAKKCLPFIFLLSYAL
ncbi:hypothetical protein RUMLAC_02002 [[Ruminococcus] lactaris ATCC 29176]|jgi:hypothetical protein|uniref:Uncharacterized protein n=1 Tax=[Ruminococcus] lactaris ATCC 29176 TaxID=471875 RepID=B5CRA2_9FIRM|nr:hypothetical protein RUMLAC_02002 [[Ruminococcus] lactaris ATCC 29176]